MDFGRVEEEKLHKLDFKLPEEPLFNRQILSGKKNTSAKVYVGCPTWGTPEWVGKIYPQQTKEKDFFDFYIEHFNSIELNATHYKIYDAQSINAWKRKAGRKDFIFCPKMYKGITHFGKLTGKDFILKEFLSSIAGFEKHLGPIFIQLSDAFSSNRKDELVEFLKSLPTHMQFFLELRHADWFKEPRCQELFETLHSLNIGAVITDTVSRRDCAHMHLTIPKVFIRYVGNNLHQVDYKRIDAWVERMKYWLNNGISEIYFFMHMHNEVTSPEFTVYLVDKMNAKCGLNLIKPEFINRKQENKN